MKRRIIDWIYRLLASLAPVDGTTPTLVRMKAVKPVAFVVRVQHAHCPHISRTRAAMSHHCDIPPWGTAGGSWYCPLCRTWRSYQPLPLPREEATAPHYIPRVRGRHSGHLRYINGEQVDTGKLLVVGRT